MLSAQRTDPASVPVVMIVRTRLRPMRSDSLPQSVFMMILGPATSANMIPAKRVADSGVEPSCSQ